MERLTWERRRDACVKQRMEYLLVMSSNAVRKYVTGVEISSFPQAGRLRSHVRRAAEPR